MSERYVFPQDRQDGEAGKARAGGLTLRQYAAVQIAASIAATTHAPSVVAARAIEVADELVNQLG